MDKKTEFVREYVATAIRDLNLKTEDETVWEWEWVDSDDLDGDSQDYLESCASWFFNRHKDWIDNPSQFAIDLWFTQNGHGAGFWDGDYDEPIATVLTNSAEELGETELFIGEDGRVYQTNTSGKSRKFSVFAYHFDEDCVHLNDFDFFSEAKRFVCGYIERLDNSHRVNEIYIYEPCRNPVGSKGHMGLAWSSLDGFVA